MMVQVRLRKRVSELLQVILDNEVYGVKYPIETSVYPITIGRFSTETISVRIGSRLEVLSFDSLDDLKEQLFSVLFKLSDKDIDNLLRYTGNVHGTVLAEFVKNDIPLVHQFAGDKTFLPVTGCIQDGLIEFTEVKHESRFWLGRLLASPPKFVFYAPRTSPKAIKWIVFND